MFSIITYCIMTPTANGFIDLTANLLHILTYQSHMFPQSPELEYYDL